VRYLVLLICCVALLFAASPALADNLLQNPSFSTAGSGGQAAASWLQINGPTTSLVNSNVLPSAPANPYLVYGPNLIFVTVGTGGGLAQIFLPANSGPTLGFSEVAVYVVNGTVSIGTGNGGNTGYDASTGGVTGQWVILSAPFGNTPANMFIIYGTPGAQFYVAGADVTATPEPGSVALLGTGLIGLAGLLRRKLVG